MYTVLAVLISGPIFTKLRNVDVWNLEFGKLLEPWSTRRNLQIPTWPGHVHRLCVLDSLRNKVIKATSMIVLSDLDIDTVSWFTATKGDPCQYLHRSHLYQEFRVKGLCWHTSPESGSCLQRGLEETNWQDREISSLQRIMALQNITSQIDTAVNW